MAIKIIASIQARMGSSRLPGKVLLPLGGMVLLDLMIARLSCLSEIDRIVVATSLSDADDKIAALFEKDEKVEVFRGSENDVLNRLANLGSSYPDHHHLELFGDSPFICTEILARGVASAMLDPSAIVTNARENLFPHGMEFYIYPFSLLLQHEAELVADDPLREHGGSNLLISNLNRVIDLQPLAHERFEEVYLEIDEPADYKSLSAIAEVLKARQIFPHFTLNDILAVIRDNPDILENGKVERRWREIQSQF